MPGVHSSVPEMMQLSRLSPEIPRIDILDPEPESQMGNNLFDMLAASHFSGSSGNNVSFSNGNNGNNILQEKSMFPEISAFSDHGTASQALAAPGGAGAGAGTGPGREAGGFDSFQFLRRSMFVDRERELEDPRALQASPSSVEIEAPITKLWTTDYDEPHYSDGGGSCEQQHGSYESLDNTTNNDDNNNNNNNKTNKSNLTASLKANSSWGVSRSSSALEPTAASKPKRKRSRPCKSSEEVESQRMTHIAVERNRRRQMNEHLRVLRQLMPGSYVQRGDQASIIGGAIEFVKELQQLLQCLEEQKKRKMSFAEAPVRMLGSPTILQAVAGFPYAPGPRPVPPPDVKYFDGGFFEPLHEVYGEAKSELAEVEVKIMGMAADIKILSQKKPGQLLKTMTALENHLLFTIVHTNVTTIEQTVLYSFHVKISQDCGLANDIAVFILRTLESSTQSSIEELQLQQQ